MCDLLGAGKVARFHPLLSQVHKLRLPPFRCIQRVRSRAGRESYFASTLFLPGNIDLIEPLTVDILEPYRVLLEPE
jgi:hypothetical protein